VSRLPQSVVVIPFILMVFAVHMTRAHYPLSSGWYYGSSARQKYEVVHEWLEQIKVAEEQGVEHIVLQLPTRPNDSPAQWAIAEMSYVLKNHKIIRWYTEFSFVE
jgi:hypothetical protein